MIKSILYFIPFLCCFHFAASAQTELLFDGGDQVTVAHHSDFDIGSNDFTVEVLVRDLFTSNNIALVTKRSSSSNGGHCIQIPTIKP